MCQAIRTLPRRKAVTVIRPAAARAPESYKARPVHMNNTIQEEPSVLEESKSGVDSTKCTPADVHRNMEPDRCRVKFTQEQGQKIAECNVGQAEDEMLSTLDITDAVFFEKVEDETMIEVNRLYEKVQSKLRELDRRQANIECQ